MPSKGIRRHFWLPPRHCKWPFSTFRRHFEGQGSHAQLPGASEHPLAATGAELWSHLEGLGQVRALPHLPLMTSHPCEACSGSPWVACSSPVLTVMFAPLKLTSIKTLWSAFAFVSWSGSGNAGGFLAFLPC